MPRCPSDDNNLSLLKISEEFDKEKNFPLTPKDFTISSGKKVWWKCKNNHFWQSSINSRTKRNGNNCPCCAGQKSNEKDNLYNEFKKLCDIEWDWEKNTKHPKDYLSGSHVKAWWKCKYGHSWTTAIRHRTERKCGCPFCYGKYPSKNRNLLYSFPDVVLDWNYDVNLSFPSNYLPKSTKLAQWKCHVCKFEWSARIQNRTLQNNGCPKCSKKVSKNEEIIVKWIKENITTNIIRRDRKILHPYELDIFLPDYNIAIEHNGIFFHCEKFKNKNFHLNKTKEAEKNSITLLHFYEDEIWYKFDIVKSIILHKCGKSKKIYARNLFVKEIDSSTSNNFFLYNHIDRGVPHFKTFALCDKNDKIYCALSIRKPLHKKYSEFIEIARFANTINTVVVGGFSKLLKSIEIWCMNNSFKNILSYADKRIGNGNVYLRCGFTLIGETGPNYWYTDFKNRFNRFKFRAKLNKTEKEVATENHMHKIYGCGSNIYVKIINDNIKQR